MNKLADNTVKKQRGKPFRKGNSGNPDGRPKGSRNYITLAMQALLDGEAEAITRKAIELAKEGDITAIRLMLERILPARKECPIHITLPEIITADDIVKGVGAIISAVAAGELTPSEGQAVAGMLDNLRRTLETQELEQRINALETTIDRRR